MKKLLSLCAVAALLFAGCVDDQAACEAPSATCGNVCTNLDTDPANCGGCGVACGGGEVCAAGQCACPGGRTRCDGTCADTLSDPRHCGACGEACAEGMLCQQGACVLDCAAPAQVCGGACVDTQNDRGHCGACDQACAQGQSCVAGECRSTIFAACFNTGELVALDDDLVAAASSTIVGGGPYALASGEGRLLVGDGIDDELYSFDPASSPLRKTGADGLGRAVNQVLVHGSRAYAINTTANDVQVLDLTRPSPTGPKDNSRTVDQVPTAVGTPPDATNTSPSFGAFVGDKLLVTLTGTCGAAGDLVGNKLLELDFSDEKGRVTRELTFPAADFEKDATATVNSPRPSGIAAVGSRLFVAIGNLNPSCVGSAGPGYLAVVETAGEELEVTQRIKLPEACRNPAFVLATDSRVFVTCPGSYGWGATPDEALVVLDAATLEVVGTTTFPRCGPSDPFDGPDACRTAVPGRLALRGDRLLVADSNAGRLFVTDLDGKHIAGREAGLRVCGLKCQADGTNCYQLTADVHALP